MGGLELIGGVIFATVFGGSALGQLAKRAIAKRLPPMLERTRPQLPPVVTQSQVSQLLRVAMMFLIRVNERESQFADRILTTDDSAEIQELIKAYQEPTIAEHELLKLCVRMLTTLRTKQADAADIWKFFEPNELPEVDQLLAAFYGNNQNPSGRNNNG